MLVRKCIHSFSFALCNAEVISTGQSPRIAKIKTTKPLQCNGVRVHLYAYLPHLEVLKHFTYVQYGYGKPKIVYCLHHDIMVSFPLNNHQELLKNNQASAVQWCKGALICLNTSLKGAKTLYKCPLWMWKAIKDSLQLQPP